MKLSTRLSLAYGAVALVDTVLAGSRRPKAHRARRFTKPLLMPLLAASTLSDPSAKSSPLRTTVAVGQAAGWIGDVLLLSESQTAFVRGAGSFAVGHASYIAGFRRNGVPTGTLADDRAARAVAAIWLVAAPMVARNAAKHDKSLAPVVLGYSAILSTTTISAIGLAPEVPAAARSSAVAGGLLFLLSDSLLGARKFLVKDEVPVLESAVMATYTAAQFLIGRSARAA